MPPLAVDYQALQDAHAQLLLEMDAVKQALLSCQAREPYAQLPTVQNGWVSQAEHQALLGNYDRARREVVVARQLLQAALSVVSAGGSPSTEVLQVLADAAIAYGQTVRGPL